MSKPFSTYPEDHAKLIALADAVLAETDDSKVIQLADLVQSILRDETAYGETCPRCGNFPINAEGWPRPDPDGVWGKASK